MVSRSRSGITLVEVLVIIVILTVLIALLLPAFSTSHTPSYRARCQANLRQLSVALLMYAFDNEDQLPPAGAWADGISPFLLRSTVWDCLSRPDQRPAYGFNSLLHRRKTKAISSPEKQPMIFESRLGRWNANDAGSSFVVPHQGLGLIAYVDGHVKAEKAMPRPDAGLIAAPRMAPERLDGRGGARGGTKNDSAHSIPRP